MERGKNPVLRTLSYFKIFNYPLTKEELWHFLDETIPFQEFEKILENTPKKNSLYFPAGNKEFIAKRIERAKASRAKIKKAIKYARKLSNIPTIKLIGISGSLAMKNSKKSDDIDIFVISKKGFVWLTRLIMVLSLNFFGVYRSKNKKRVQDKFCLNFVVGENKMHFDKAKQNLYLAHEIVQLLPIYQKDNAYSAFLKKNDWVGHFLPNYKGRIKYHSIPINKNTTKLERFFIKLLNLAYLEKIARFVQYLYMKRGISSEEVGKDLLAFHPRNYENIVLKKLKIEAKKDTRGH